MADKPTILETGQRITKTTIAAEGSKPLDGDPEVTGSITSEHQGDRMSWSVSGWIKRVFKRGGTSAGVKAEIDF